MTYLLWHYLTDSARKHPSRPAVAWRGTVLSYAELDEQSNRVASLLAASGIGPGSRVGLYMPKSHLSVVAMLGTLKAGAAYVPVDPNAPVRRVAFILDDCAVRGLITTTDKLVQLHKSSSEMTSLETILLADSPGGFTPPNVHARVHRWEDLGQVAVKKPAPDVAIESDPAYLLYTSGSTGSPKGVILTHRNALTFVEWGAETFGVRPDDRLSNHAPLHFDLSVFDIYVALRSGACVVIVPDQVAPFPVELARWIDAEEISIWYSVPSALTRLLLHGKLERFAYRKLRTVLFAGEVFPVKYLREVIARLSNAEFYNLYGPTETNVCTYYKVPSVLDPEAVEIPIGRGCANTEVFALDDSGSPISAAQTGELYVRGPSVMPGYWGLPEKSRDVLVRNRLQAAFDERIYRTGDIVRLEADGNYSFIGRKDHMVKSRGYRIELGEIEQVLYQHGQVREAVVVAVPDEEIGTRLKAVIAPHAEGALSEAELQAFCAARLPRYMVPEVFLFRSDLPKTSTEKTDRQALSKIFSSPQEETSNT